MKSVRPAASDFYLGVRHQAEFDLRKFARGVLLINRFLPQLKEFEQAYPNLKTDHVIMLAGLFMHELEVAPN